MDWLSARATRPTVRGKTRIDYFSPGSPGPHVQRPVSRALYYTPKSGSWLNMIEIEFSAIARQCLRRRIPDQAQLRREVLSCIAERDQNKLKIHWQFSLEKARDRFQSHYARIRETKRGTSKTS